MKDKEEKELTDFERDLLHEVRQAKERAKTVTYTILVTHGIVRLYRADELVSDQVDRKNGKR